jgi:type III secretory pathway component EscU
VVVAITAILVCMCYMVNARRAQKQRDDVSWDMQMRGVEVERELEMEEGNSEIDGRRVVKE